jgi:outer membrane lipoprotein-sorting protein
LAELTGDAALGPYLLNRRILVAALLTVAAPTPAFADAPAPLSADDKALVDKAADYLQSLDAVRGRFEQTDAKGGVSHGDLFLKRPGRARFVFDPPSGVLVVSDGSTVMVTNPRLQTTNRYPLGSTPLSLFLAKQVRLDKGVAVSAVTRFSDGFALTAHDARHPAQGQITLLFGDKPMVLREWRITDGQGRTTQFRLTNLEPAPGLDANYFVVPQARPIR